MTRVEGNELEGRNQELATLIDIMRDIPRTLNLTEVLKRVTRLAARACAANRCTLVLREENDHTTWNPVMAMFADGREDAEMWTRFQEKGHPLQLDGVPEAERVIRERRPLFVADAPNSSLPPDLIQPFGVKSVLLVPLIGREEVMGLMALDHVEEEAGFTDRQVDLAVALSAQAALAIEDARLYERERQRARQASLLNEVARQANTILTPERLLPAVAQTIHEHFDYDSVMLMLVDQDSGDLTIAGKSGAATDTIPEEFRQPLSQGIIGWAARHGEPLLVNDVTRDERYYAPFPERFQAGSELAVPLQIDGETIGVLDLQRREVGGFDEMGIATAQTLAEQIAGALQNARLYDEAQRRVEELTALRNIDVALTSTLSIDEVLERIHRQISRVIPTTTFYVGIYDERREILSISVVVDRGRRLDPVTLKVDQGGGFAGWVVRHGEPLWIDDWEEQKATLPTQGLARGTPTRSLMVLPLVSRGETVGVISAQSYEPHAFDEHHRRLFSAAAGQVAIAVENARLFEQTKRRLTETRLLKQIMQAAAAHLDFDKVLERTIDALHEALDLDHFSFVVPDEDGKTLSIHPSQIGYGSTVTDARVPMDGSISGRAYQTGEPQVVPDVREVPHSFDGSPDIRSELNVPVTLGGNVVAVLKVDSPEVNAFGEEDIHLFQAVAAQLGVVLENTRLYERLQEQKDELREAFEKLSEADRLRAELVQNVSHELRTPFSLVQGYIDLMLEEDLGPIQDEQRYALEVIRSRMGTLKTLFRDLAMLDEVARREASPTPTSMVDAMSNALDDFQPLARRANIRFQEDLPKGLPPVQADKEQLTQVFAHLLDNAIKFSPDGGIVAIRGWQEKRDEGWYSCVSVSDEGIGIEPEHLDHIFERFYQADGGAARRFGGMGIGLALVREIVEAHDGEVSVESAPQEGSTFTVSLPQVGGRTHLDWQEDQPGPPRTEGV